MPYLVFIERTRDLSPQAPNQVAAAISAAYGVPVQGIAQAIRGGHYRVKQDADLDTATRVANYLETLGAICSIECVATGSARQAVGSPEQVTDPLAALGMEFL